MISIDPDAFRREAQKLTRELRQQAPRRYARGGPVMSGAQVIITNGPADGWLPPPASLDPPAPTGCQHPHPEPVVLTTDEIVAAVCPDCLQPLPASFVGSEWKP